MQVLLTFDDSILHRICRFKGSDRSKRGYTAASWFLKPGNITN